MKRLIEHPAIVATLERTGFERIAAFDGITWAAMKPVAGTLYIYGTTAEPDVVFYSNPRQGFARTLDAFNTSLDVLAKLAEVEDMR